MSDGPASRHDAWWAADSRQLLDTLGSSADGLSSETAAAYGVEKQDRWAAHGGLRLFIRQFTTPLVLILIIGALLSLVLREWVDATIILAIITGSGILGFTQEWSASRAIAELRSRLVRRVRLLRDAMETSVPIDRVVPGDVVLLKAGDLVPGDGQILASDSLLVDQAVLTGEPFPVEKRPGASSGDTPVAERSGSLFLGTSIRSGTARMLVVTTGKHTTYGAIESSLERAEEDTEFARGLAGFGSMLMRVMLVVVAVVLAVSLGIGRDPMDSILFAMALAVAISPQLLPAIVSVTLAAGARRMTDHGVLVRRLEAIENLGGMDVLCTDKTGTLTKGAIALSAAITPDGIVSAEVLRLASVNALFQTAMASALDEAVLAGAAAASLDVSETAKLRDIPYDFVRRRYSVLAKDSPGAPVWITKGAVNEVLATCITLRRDGSRLPLDPTAHARLEALVKAKAGQGFRALAVATGEEGEACLEGLLLFFDPPKPGIKKTVTALKRRGISVRIVSGDNRFVSAHMAELIGLPPGQAMTGRDVAALSDEQLACRISDVAIFAEVEPQQKDRIVRAFQRAGHAVGFVGDGINDAPALRAADVGISVESAVDVARESADIVLLRPDLNAILRGVEDGRRTFANTLKYIAITTSANFGNMVSMALAAVILPFLPLLPVQILLNNFLSDLPAIAIAGDAVDPERLATAQRWDIRRIRNFMLVFGLISTAFDLASFALLRMAFGADADHFRTSWFVLSLLTELAALFVLRTRRAFWKSPPSHLLLWSSVFVAVTAGALPYSGRIAQLVELVPVPAGQMASMLGLVIVYAAVTEFVKRRNHLERQ